MCGVFAYKGDKADAAAVIFAGLKTLEYRGYDSWGIAVQSTEKIALQKQTGKIGDSILQLPQSTVGIGHTRWATHGGVTKENAHPHMDCTGKIALLHNGIIENFAELKKTLMHHAFSSETDTEVLIHLIEDLRKKFPLREAVRMAFQKITGLNAVVVLDNTTGEIVAVKNGSPLVIGVGDNAYFIASDVTGILPYTKKVIFLEDNELVTIDKKLAIRSVRTNKILQPKIETLQWHIESADKGKFAHFMLKEIYEQPQVLENLATTAKENIEKIATAIKKTHGTFFIGAGTAYHATLAGTYLFSHIAKRHVNTQFASEFNYLEDFLNEKSLVIALSQSGETIDVIEPLQRAKRKKAHIMSITNTLGSTLYRMSDTAFLLHAGPEKAVASTKVYTAKLATLLLTAYALVDAYATGQKIVLAAAGEIERLFEKANVEKIQKLAKKLMGKEHMYTIGRGFAYATALEAALKIKEVSYIHTEGLAGGELKHGPIALIEKNTPCIVFAPADESYDAIISNATEIKARGGFIVGVSSKNAPIFDAWIEVKDTGMGSLITQIIPIQLLSYYLALYKKLDPDKPRNLAKSVTVK